MPGRDATGPTGWGPATGRGFGPCTRRRGFGYGSRASSGLAYSRTKEQEIANLRAEREALKAEISGIEQALEQLEARKD